MVCRRQHVCFGALPRVLTLLSPWTWLVLGWALASTALYLGQALGMFWLPLFSLLDWQPDLWTSQPWRLWTAALVHWSGAHLLLNLLACVALVAWGNAAALGARPTLAWLAAWPLTHLLLAMSPSLVRYGGLSGVLHAGVAVGAWSLLYRGDGPHRWLGAGVSLGLLVKLVLEVPALAQWFGLAAATMPLADAPGFTVASYAHLSGAVSGLACAIVLDLVLGRDRHRGRS
jgi:rhomboid family GlyGly-CTERM serine protease